MPGKLSGGFGQIRTQCHLGSLGEISGNKAMAETISIYAAFLKESSVGVKLFAKVSGSISILD